MNIINVTIPIYDWTLVVCYSVDIKSDQELYTVKNILSDYGMELDRSELKEDLPNFKLYTNPSNHGMVLICNKVTNIYDVAGLLASVSSEVARQIDITEPRLVYFIAKTLSQLDFLEQVKLVGGQDNDRSK